MNRSGKTRSANSATLLLFIIGLILVLYILFLPPDERAKILGENPTGTGGSGGPGYNALNDTRILVKGLHLDYLSMDQFDHDITPFYLFSTQEPIEIVSGASFYVKNNWFSTQDKQIIFTVDDPKLFEDVKFSFMVKRRVGMLRINLNKATIFEGEVTQDNVGPISIPQDKLQKNNTLVFTVSDVGGRFWQTHEFSISNLKIVGTRNDLTRQQSSNVVILSKEEVSNLDEATLRFYPDCVESESGVLTVTINGRTLVNQVPDCSMLNKFNIPADYIKEGSNIILFKVAHGSFLIDQIQLRTKLKDEVLPLYYFDVNQDEYDAIVDQDLAFNLSFEFVSGYRETQKEFDVIVNGHLFHVDTYDDIYNHLLVLDWIDEGVNYLQIDPKQSIDIVEMRLELIDLDYNDSDNNYYSEDDDNCIKKYVKRCYRGDVWWYDSCGDRYRMEDRCNSYEDCESGRCVDVR